MIWVERTECPEPLKPGEPEKRSRIGARELEKAAAKIASGVKPASKDFKAYGHDDVRNALKEMFHGKCAYCEMKVSGGIDTDVEHYRPKAGVTEADEAGVDHPGYWWLAMVWENLVPSCTHCNQMRSNHLHIPPGLQTEAEFKAFLEDADESGSGKGNYFPTEDDFWVTAPGDLSAEKPLILDPTGPENPEDHLEWVIFDGVASVVRARGGSPAGETSINVLGLNRRWLEEHRRTHLLQMRLYRNLIIKYANARKAAQTDQEKRSASESLNDMSNLLWAMTDERQPFRALSFAFIEVVQEEVRQIMEGVPAD